MQADEEGVRQLAQWQVHASTHYRPVKYRTVDLYTEISMNIDTRPQCHSSRLFPGRNALIRKSHGEVRGPQTAMMVVTENNEDSICLLLNLSCCVVLQTCFRGHNG